MGPGKGEKLHDQVKGVLTGFQCPNRRKGSSPLQSRKTTRNWVLTSNQTQKESVISGFGRGVVEICALLGCYTATNGNPLPTFRDKMSGPSSRAKRCS
jgi:hypothetical protein